MELSIIIPALEESSKIDKDIILADHFLDQYNLIGEIIVVDDGSKDNTFEIALRTGERVKCNVTVLKNEVNSGKGNAVKKGVLHSSGLYVMYADSGTTVPFENAITGLELIKNNLCDIAIGSRKLPTSHIVKNQDLDRALISKLFKFIMKLSFNSLPQLTDTQCGFKIYKGNVARELFSELQINGFLFEIEFILKAVRSKYKILEFPVEWSCDRDSRISLLKSPWKVFSDLIRIKRMGF